MDNRNIKTAFEEDVPQRRHQGRARFTDRHLIRDVSSDLIRQPKTRWQELDEMMDNAYDAFDRDRIVEAIYWFVIADLRGVRSFVSEIMICVDKWNMAGRPAEERSIGGAFTREQYDFGWAALMWFSQAVPEQGVDWMVTASLNGNRDARMFGFKFFGSGMFRSNEERKPLRDYGLNFSTMLGFLTVIVVLLTLLLALGVYMVANYSHFLSR